VRRPFATLLLAVLCVVLTTSPVATQPSVDDLLARVGDRVASFYKRAQHVIFLETSTVQPVDLSRSSQGFSRTVESELRVEAAEGDGDATVVRDVRKVNGRAPREKDRKDRSGCTDPNPLSTEPRSFLLPAHRSEYQFKAAGTDRERNRLAFRIDFVSANRKSNPELIEDPGGHDDCFDWTGPIAIRGQLWIDADTHDVLRLDRYIAGPTDVRVPARLQTIYRFPPWLTIDRDDLTLRFKAVTFTNPDETMLLPEAIESRTVVRTGLQSIRRTQVFSDYRRFLTSSRIR